MITDWIGNELFIAIIILKKCYENLDSFGDETKLYLFFKLGPNLIKLLGAYLGA